MTKPNINVTPLIDVLLVLLIIFMLISPLKPSDFKTKIPQETKQAGTANDHALVVSVNAGDTLKLNLERDLGTIENPQKLIERLENIFAERDKNGVFDESNEKIVKTVFIKAPRLTAYGDVVKIVDAVKIAGADPVGLQIDDLE